MANLQPIRIGDTFRRTYTRKNPDGSPLDLTGLSHTWNLKTATKLFTFDETHGVTVTPLLGKIVVDLTTAQTVLFPRDTAAHSYLEVEDGVDTYTRARHRERVLRRED